MSTNIYRSEQRIFYSPPEPTTYYGWHVSWSGDMGDCYPFSEPEHQDAWVAYVASHFGSKYDKWEIENIAALLAMAEWGEEKDQYSASETAFDHYSGACDATEWDVLTDLASGFDPSTGEPRPVASEGSPT